MARDDDDRPRRRDRGEDDGGGRRGKFQYKGRSAADLSRREQGGMYDQITKGKFPTFMPKEGDFCVRILPPPPKLGSAWGNYGMDVYVHYGIGPDGNRYLCPARMTKNEQRCPVCEEWARAKQEGDEEYAKDLRPTKRVAVWVIDRDHEDKGPQFWAMPQTLDQDIAKLSYSKRSGETLMVDDPEKGHDIEFSIKKEGKKKTSYVGIKIASKPTPVADDDRTATEWLDFVMDNQIPDVLNQFPSEYIEKVFSGGKSKAAKRGEEEEDERPKTRNERKSSRDDEDEEDRPRSRRRDADEEEDERPKRRKEIDDEDEDLDDDAPKSRKRSRDEDEDEDERPKAKRRDADEDEEEEEERPRKRARDEDDEEEDERPKARVKVRSRDAEDDEDEDKPKSKRRDEDDEEDEDRSSSNLKDKIRKGMRTRD